MGWIAVVLNEASGTGECAAVAKRLEVLFAEAGRDVRINVALSGAQLRAAMTRALEEGCEALVVGGGDGTINGGAAAVLESGTPLGVLPLGTLNHFAKDLGIPLDLEEAVQVILRGVVCRVDVGQVNDRIFLNNSSIGVYPTIVRMRQRYQATGWGKWVAALWASLAVLRRNPFMAVKITAEGQALVRRTPFVFVGNNEYRMSGLRATARDSLSGGRLAVYVLNAERRTGLLRLALQVLRKGVEEVKELDLLTVDSATIEVRRHRLQVALDGEVVSQSPPMEYRARPGALRVYIPESALACYPHPGGPSSNRA